MRSGDGPRLARSDEQLDSDSSELRAHSGHAVPL